ncbi:HutD family protein [Marinomonas sp. RSW2]|uniref:HutD family protein n=1 Tax=Marinomonas maritima TaxID=2940935 RepID=A0ABT5WA11_9GAMM|nr:HutD family protein [Marinomonas maritima]MDE8601658.1 HutD family protein [Marinomonas maritima]
MTFNTDSNYHLTTQNDYKRMPWKNGLGETLEIYLSEDESGQRYRISQAAVKDNGVFSNFDGLHRTLVLLSGQGMQLSHKSIKGNVAEHDLKSPLDMARFAGGDETLATLHNGSIEDLNIMVRETDTKANVSACFAPFDWEVKSHKNRLLTAFYANQTCTISVNETENMVLEQNSFLNIKQNETLCLIEGNGVFIEVLSTKVAE